MAEIGRTVGGVPNACMRRVAEGTLRPEDVVIFYFEKKEKGTEVARIEVDEAGRLTKELPGFFEEDFNEALERLRASMKKLGGKLD